MTVTIENIRVEFEYKTDKGVYEVFFVFDDEYFVELVEF